MNAPEREPVRGLTPEAAELVETYFARVHGALLVAASGECEDAVDDLRTHVLEELAASAGTSADVTRVLAELGPPEAIAAEYAESAEDEGPRHISDVDSVRLHGRLLGMPYELRVPNSDRIASRWWNPLDSRIFVPRVFGLGWDINFGALAVLLHLVRPDDEDEPFAAVPEPVVNAALAFPLLLTAALLVLVAVSWAGLPAQVPSHWDFAGRVDQLWARGPAMTALVLLSLLPSLLAVSVFVRRRPALNRVAVTALATFMSTVALSVLAQTLFTLGGGLGTAPTIAGLVLAFLLPFVLLVTLSRMGRAAEQRRDMSGSSKKGSV